MKTKFNIILLALCLMLFCFTGSTYAAEDLKLEQFKKDGYETIHIFIAEIGPNYPVKQAFVVYSKFAELKDVDINSYFVPINNLTGFTLKPSTYDYYVVNYYQNALGDDWSAQSTISVTSLGSNKQVLSNGTMSSEKFIYSTADVHTADGQLFFQKTPVVTTIAPVELGQLAEKITGTMGEITIIAVSCLALLILLPLFWKVLFRFL